MNSTVSVKNNVVQARKTALAGNYDNLPRLIKDIGNLFQRHQKLYPSENEIQGIQGKTLQLSLQGNIDLRHSVTNKECNVKIKITLLKDYPKSKPIIALQNSNQQSFDPNPAYLSTGLARYQKSIKDGRMYMYLEFMELKTWSVNSELMKVMYEIQKRLSDNLPFIKKNNYQRDSITTTYISFGNDTDPTLRSQLSKTKAELSELQNDFETLIAHKQEVIFNVAYNEVIQRELSVKYAELSHMSQKINQLVTDYSKSGNIDDTNVDQLLEMNDKSKKLLQTLSQRDALEECLQFLKDQLKNGTKLAELNDSFRRMYEDFFNNQLQMNQI